MEIKKEGLDKNNNLMYHLYCESCEYDWWTDNINEECPICKGVIDE